MPPAPVPREPTPDDPGWPHFVHDGPAAARATVVLAHGAGAPMDSPFLQQVAVGLAACAIRVLRFEFPYMAARRHGVRKGPDRATVLLATWRRAVAAAGAPGDLVIGGKSLGGRIASMVADELGVRGLFCLGYPFHPLRQPSRLRTAHLAELRTPALIVQGERDPFGTREEVAGYALSPSIALAWLPDGGHSFETRARAAVRTEQNLAHAIEAVAAFVAARWQGTPQ